MTLLSQLRLQEFKFRLWFGDVWGMIWVRGMEGLRQEGQAYALG